VRFQELPEARVTGIAAGVHATVALPCACDESAIRREAARRGIPPRNEARLPRRGRGRTSVLILGYGHMPESAMTLGARELAKAVRAAA
jgi:GntR family transcriptional regulator/MocR family aminotransferase